MAQLPSRERAIRVVPENAAQRLEPGERAFAVSRVTRRAQLGVKRGDAPARRVAGPGGRRVIGRIVSRRRRATRLEARQARARGFGKRESGANHLVGRAIRRRERLRLGAARVDAARRRWRADRVAVVRTLRQEHHLRRDRGEGPEREAVDAALFRPGARQKRPLQRARRRLGQARTGGGARAGLGVRRVGRDDFGARRGTRQEEVRDDGRDARTHGVRDVPSADAAPVRVGRRAHRARVAREHGGRNDRPLPRVGFGGAETREPSTREYVAPRLRRRPGGPDVEQAEQAVRRHLRADPQRADRARVARQERAARAVPERLGEARQDPRGERDDARARRAARVLRAVSRLGRGVREQEKHAPRLHGGAGRGEVPESEHRGLFLARRGGGRRGCAADQLRGGGKHLDGFVMVVLVLVLLVFPRAPAEGIRFWERDAQAETPRDLFAQNSWLIARLEHREHARDVAPRRAPHRARAILQQRDERAGQGRLKVVWVELEERAKRSRKRGARRRRAERRRRELRRVAHAVVFQVHAIGKSRDVLHEETQAGIQTSRLRRLGGDRSDVARAEASSTRRHRRRGGGGRVARAPPPATTSPLPPAEKPLGERGGLRQQPRAPLLRRAVDGVVRAAAAARAHERRLESRDGTVR